MSSESNHLIPTLEEYRYCKMCKSHKSIDSFRKKKWNSEYLKTCSACLDRFNNYRKAYKTIKKEPVEVS